MAAIFDRLLRISPRPSAHDTSAASSRAFGFTQEPARGSPRAVSGGARRGERQVRQEELLPPADDPGTQGLDASLSRLIDDAIWNGEDLHPSNLEGSLYETSLIDLVDEIENLNRL